MDDMTAMMTEAEELAARDIRRMQSREPVVVIEAVAASPLDQKSHTLLVEALDHLAQHFVEQQKADREASIKAEALYLEQIGLVKDALNRLHLVGVAARGNSERSNEANRGMLAELEKINQMLEGQAA